MKRIEMYVVVAMVMCLGLCGCDKKDNKDSKVEDLQKKVDGLQDQIGKLAEENKAKKSEADVLKIQLNASAATMTVSAEANKKLQVELAEARQVASDAEKALQALPAGMVNEALKARSGKVHEPSVMLRTGLAEDIYEAGEAAEKYLRASGKPAVNPTSIIPVRPSASAATKPNTAGANRSARELKDTIGVRSNRIRATEVSLAVMKNSVNESSDPGVRAFRRSQIEQFEEELIDMKTELSDLKTSLANAG